MRKHKEFTNDAEGAMNHFMQNIADDMLTDKDVSAEVKGRIRAAMQRHHQELMNPNDIRGFLKSLQLVEVTTTIEFG